LRVDNQVAERSDIIFTAPQGKRCKKDHEWS
jgi:hypothetical protein